MLDTNWKDDFLASIDEEEDEDTEKEEDKENKKKSKPGFQIRIKTPEADREREPLQEIQLKRVFVKLEKRIDEEVQEKPKPQPVSKPKEEELSAYEKMRLKNIEEKRQMMAALRAELQKGFGALSRKPPRPQVRPHKPYKRRMVFVQRREPIKLRSRRNSLGSSEGESSNCNSEKSTPKKRRFWEEYEDESDDEFMELGPAPKRYHPNRWTLDPNTNFLAPEDVTEYMLNNVCDRVSDKVYNQARGTTCHQCRQKTLDTKTICRSGHCAGGRGIYSYDQYTVGLHEEVKNNKQKF